MPHTSCGGRLIWILEVLSSGFEYRKMNVWLWWQIRVTIHSQHKWPSLLTFIIDFNYRWLQVTNLSLLIWVISIIKAFKYELFEYESFLNELFQYESMFSSINGLDLNECLVMSSLIMLFLMCCLNINSLVCIVWM